MLRRIVLERVLLQQRAETVGLHGLIGMHGTVGQVRQPKQRRQRQDREDESVPPLRNYFFPSPALGVASAFKSPSAYWMPARTCSTIAGFQKMSGLCANP